MFVELHILQNFAPSNLNRDDTGSPKDCEFGGFRRARISSQCLKRAVRVAFRDGDLVDADARAWRTKRLLDETIRRLAGRGRPEDAARGVVEAALSGVGFSVRDEGKTEYLLFLGEREIEALAEACHTSWDELSAKLPDNSPDAPARARKRAGREAVSANVKQALERALDGGKAADVALFGRMLADRADLNIDAAAQVAHAISTHRVSMEFDYYTAVDDLNPSDTAGAGMIGAVEFNSACYYRYANVDVSQLSDNLQGDRELTLKTVEAFVRASIGAVPSGKQHSTAAQNPPSVVMAVVRHHGLWSLANAFIQPAAPGEGASVVDRSAEAMDTYWQRLTDMYGREGVRRVLLATYLPGELMPNLVAHRVPDVSALVAGVLEGVR